jgi:hypothetical protein
VNSESEGRLSKYPRTQSSVLDITSTEVEEAEIHHQVNKPMNLVNSNLDGKNVHEQDTLNLILTPINTLLIMVDLLDDLLRHLDTHTNMAITTRTDLLPLVRLLMLDHRFLTLTDPCLPVDVSFPFLNITPIPSLQSRLTVHHLNHQCTLLVLRDSGLRRPLTRTPTLTTRGHTLPIPLRTTTTSIRLLLLTMPQLQDHPVQHTPIPLLQVVITPLELLVLALHPYKLLVKGHTLNTPTLAIRPIRLSNTPPPTNSPNTHTETMTESDEQKMTMKIRERCHDPLRPRRRT